VYFTHAGYREFYWVSSPQAQHSRNIEQEPAIAIVIFDSSAPVGQGRAVYIDAGASEIAESDLPGECAKAFTQLDSSAVAFEPAELSGAAPLRLYRATATSHEVHVRGRDPKYGKGIDTRMTVSLE
jgi:hypothetical protein